MFGQKERGTAKGTSFMEISILLELSSDDLVAERVARNWSECVSIDSLNVERVTREPTVFTDGEKRTRMEWREEVD